MKALLIIYVILLLLKIFLSEEDDPYNMNDYNCKFTMTKDDAEIYLTLRNINVTYHFDSNSNDEIPGNTVMMLKEGETYTFSAPTSNYPEHEFISWTRISDNKEFKVGDSVTIEGDESFRANWKEKEYSITCESNIEEAKLKANINSSAGRYLTKLKAGDTFKINLRDFDDANYVISKITMDGEEIENKTVGVRSRKDGDIGQMPIDEFINKVKEEVAKMIREGNSRRVVAEHLGVSVTSITRWMQRLDTEELKRENTLLQKRIDQLEARIRKYEAV